MSDALINPVLDSALNKIRHNYNSICEQIKLPAEMEIDDQYAPAAIFLTNLIPIANSKILLLGEPSTGKTVLAQAVSYSTCGDPTKLKVSGHDKMTLESDFAEVDPGRLISESKLCERAASAEISEEQIFGMTSGQRKEFCDKFGIEWANVLEVRTWMKDYGCAILDELARFPEGYQNVTLDWLETGRFSHHGAECIRETGMAIATSNWPGKRSDPNSMVDAGTHKIVEALLNRFEGSVVVPSLTSDGRDDVQNKTKKNLEKSGKMNGSFDYSKLEVLSRDEIEALQKAASQIEFESELPLYLNLNLPLTAMDVCKYGGGRKSTYWMGFDQNKCLSCENYGASDPGSSQPTKEPHPCSYFYLALGPRVDQSVIKLAKAAALFLGKEKVDGELIKSIFPYVVQHRVKPTNKFRESAEYAGSMVKYIQKYLQVVDDWRESNETYIDQILFCENSNQINQLQSKNDIMARIMGDVLLNSLFESRADTYKKKLIVR
jgi:MoxR-like ATPase